MGAFSIWHWVVVLVIVLVLFGGKGKISSLMGDFGKGLRSFKKGMKEDDAVGSEGGDTKTIPSDTASRETDQEKDRSAQN